VRKWLGINPSTVFAVWIILLLVFKPKNAPYTSSAKLFEEINQHDVFLMTNKGFCFGYNNTI
jgi:hypothetical protein